MRCVTVASLLLGGCLTGPALAATDASQWLGRLLQAEQQQSYLGTFIHERSGSFSTHDIWHRVQSGRVTERLFQLDGAAQEALRVNGQASCQTPAQDAAIVPVAGPGMRFDPLKLMSWYDLSVAGESRVAGRKAVIINLTPKDPYRYGFELHLDAQSGLLLKSLMLNDRGQLLERLQFTRLDTSTPDAQAMTAGAGCVPVASSSVAAGKASPRPLTKWRADWLPPGYELIRSSTLQGAGAVTRLLYDDGLAKFSIFIEPLDDKTANDARTQMGPTAAVSRRARGAKGDAMVTVVGEIPMGTAERIALSMRLEDDSATK